MVNLFSSQKVLLSTADVPTMHWGTWVSLISQLCEARLWQRRSWERIPEPQRAKTGKLSIPWAFKEEEKKQKAHLFPTREAAALIWKDKSKVEPCGE